MSRFLLLQGPWLALMSLIFAQSSTARIHLPNFGISWSDKVIHFSVFGLLGVLLNRGLRLSIKRVLREHHILFTYIIGFLYSFTDEWHQSFVPGRQADWLDWLADVLGIVSFVLLYNLWLKRKKRITAIAE